MAKPTLEDMIRCAEREVTMRERVYPSRVGAGKMSEDDANREIQTMISIVKTLKWIARRKQLLRLLQDASDSDVKIVEKVMDMFPGTKIDEVR